MLYLAVFAFLQFAVCVVTGANSFFKLSPSLPGKSEPPDTFTDASKQRISDINSDFGLGFTSNPKASQYKQSNSSVSFTPDEQSFLDWKNREFNKGLSLVEYFAYNFIQRVRSSKQLRDAFQTENLTAKTLSSLIYDVTLKGHLSVGTPHPDVSSKVEARAVADNFCKVKKDTLLLVFGHFIGKYLFFRGALTISNVRSLAQKYFEITKQSINSVTVPSPTAYVTAVSEAAINFLKSIKLYDAYSTNMVAGWFSDQWYVMPE